MFPNSPGVITVSVRPAEIWIEIVIKIQTGAMFKTLSCLVWDFVVGYSVAQGLGSMQPTIYIYMNLPVIFTGERNLLCTIQ